MSTEQKVLRSGRIHESMQAYMQETVNTEKIQKSINEKVQAKKIMIDLGNKARDEFITEMGIKKWSYDKLNDFMDAEQFLIQASENFASAQVYLWCASKLLKTERNKKAAVEKKVSLQKANEEQAKMIEELQKKLKHLQEPNNKKREREVEVEEPEKVEKTKKNTKKQKKK